MKKSKLRAEKGVIVDNQVYLVSADVNMIYTLNLDSYEISFFENLPDEEFWRAQLYGDIIYYEDQLILVPLMASKIWIYDIKQNIWTGIELSAAEQKLKYKFWGGVLFGDCVYMFGHYYMGVLKLNLKNNTIERINDSFKKEVDEKQIKDGMFNRNIVLMDGCIYTPFLPTNKIFRWNLVSGKYDFIEVGSKDNRYSGIVWDGKTFWLPPRKNNRYVRWDGKKEYIEYDLPQEFQKDSYYFDGAYKVGQQIIFSGFDSFSVQFDIDRPHIGEVIEKGFLFMINIDDKRLIGQDTLGNWFIKREETYLEINSQIDDNKLQKIVFNELMKSRGLQEAGVITENQVISLETWIDNI